MFEPEEHNYAVKTPDAACCRRISQPSTPRKKALRRVISRQRVTITRLRQKLRKPSTSGRRHPGHASALQDSRVPLPLRNFIKSQLHLSKRNKFGRRYTVYDRRFALSLFYTSPKAYRLCSKLFCLPSVSMLRVWMQRVLLTSGF